MKITLTLVRLAIVTLAICLPTASIISCGGDDLGEATIKGCDEVEYEEYIYNIDCEIVSGNGSFDVQKSSIVDGKEYSAAFHVVCSDGCIESVTPTEQWGDEWIER